MTIFEQIRSLLAPFDTIENYVPKTGNILDLGCGHGLFSKILAEKSQKRQVFGIDPSIKKISVAKRSYKNISNLKFQLGYLPSNKKFDCICIIDMLYLLPHKQKIQLLKNLKTILNKNGIIIIKEASTENKLTFSIIKLEEILMVKILKYTFTDFKDLFFLSQKGYYELFNHTNYKLLQAEKIQGFIPYTKSILFVVQNIHKTA